MLRVIKGGKVICKEYNGIHGVQLYTGCTIVHRVYSCIQGVQCYTKGYSSLQGVQWYVERIIERVHGKKP